MASSHEDTGHDVPEVGQGYGALPLPRVSAALWRLIGSGRVFSLQQAMRSSMPQWAAQPAYALSAVMSHDRCESALRRPVTGAFERIEHSGHSGTHVDALCHVGCWHDKGAPAYAQRQ